jgi:hypothetical protein
VDRAHAELAALASKGTKATEEDSNILRIDVDEDVVAVAVVVVVTVAIETETICKAEAEADAGAAEAKTADSSIEIAVMMEKIVAGAAIEATTIVAITTIAVIGRSAAIITDVNIADITIVAVCMKPKRFML